MSIDLERFASWFSEWGALWGVPDLASRIRVEANGRMSRRLADCRPDSGIIRIQTGILEQNGRLLREVLCHEAAHVAVFVRHRARVRPHGPEWKALMRMAGYSGRARFPGEELDALPGLRRPRRARYRHACAVCGTHWDAGKTMRRWRCAQCLRAGRSGELSVTRLAPEPTVAFGLSDSHPGPAFEQYVGIDYSGARTPTCGLPGLRVYVAGRDTEPIEARPPAGASKHWTRAGLAQWLRATLTSGPTTLVGIDHAFSFPDQYFERHRLPRDWESFLEDFHRHWPTDGDETLVDSVRKGVCGTGAARSGDARWRRLTERRTRSAKSVFHFDVPGSVAKSTHAGLPWLRYLRRELGDTLHAWPFDGWDIPHARSAILEVYPSLWSPGFPREDRTPDQHDAYSVAGWLRETDAIGRLGLFLAPELAAVEREIARSEGWILGVR